MLGATGSPNLMTFDPPHSALGFSTGPMQYRYEPPDKLNPDLITLSNEDLAAISQAKKKRERKAAKRKK